MLYQDIFCISPVGTVLEYLRYLPGMAEQLIQSVLQEIEIPTDSQEDFAAEIQLVWLQTRLTATSEGAELPLACARALALESANLMKKSLQGPGRIPRDAFFNH